MLDAWIPLPQQGSNKTSFHWRPAEQDRCKPQGAVGEEGVEDRKDMAPEAGPPGEPSISSDPHAPLKVARDPGDRTTKEREDHDATHIPFRSWCPICVKAKGREEAHRIGKGKERSCKAKVSLDYKTFGREDDRDDKATATVYKDDHTQMFLDMFAITESIRHMGDWEGQGGHCKSRVPRRHLEGRW